MAEEAEERRRRAAMNKEFKEFAQKIADTVRDVHELADNRAMEKFKSIYHSGILASMVFLSDQTFYYNLLRIV